MSDVYMDDLTGADDLESGRKLQVQLVSMLKGAGIELHKWSSSDQLLLPDSRCQVKDLSYSSSTETKTLGLLWKPHPDSFTFKISPMTSNYALESINCLDIPRYGLSDKSIRTELHGFSGSSEKTYGDALYLRCINTSGQISVRLLCSKSKELTESDFWKHVNSENNPADILSRGISPNEIQQCELCWFSPPFLHQYKELEPYDISAIEGDDLFLQELKETSDFPLCALLKNFEPLDIISNCS
ncbi:integrase catalytic domain-containing protein [Trichonephila clavipes]|nr:integrase catalytic domain-containing protein [Trichonephila clavipes]